MRILRGRDSKLEVTRREILVRIPAIPNVAAAALSPATPTSGMMLSYCI